MHTLKKNYPMQFIRLRRVWLIALFSLFIAWLITEIFLKIPETSYLRPIFFCLIIVPIAFILTYYFLIKKELASYSDFGLTKSNALRNALIGILLGVVSGIIAFIAAKYYFHLNPQGESNLAFAIIARCIAAPIWEEFVFRGMIFSSLLWVLEWRRDWLQEKRILWIGFSYIIVAIIFTFGHLGASHLLIVYFAGFVDTAAFHFTKSLITSIFTHSIYNLLQIFSIIYMF